MMHLLLGSGRRPRQPGACGAAPRPRQTGGQGAGAAAGPRVAGGGEDGSGQERAAAAPQGAEAACHVRGERDLRVRAQSAGRLLGPRRGRPPAGRRGAQGRAPRCAPQGLLRLQHHGVRRVPAHPRHAAGEEALLQPEGAFNLGYAHSLFDVIYSILVNINLDISRTYAPFSLSTCTF
ncbi:hypothetical protein PAHAL_6G227000 [Panicum hallii]|uniref:Uncharacterized protein n=1 Tax=Panicum hallii TaxID=206008 RepID=A0A2S3I3T4_9POAL|nr:hypothetical protein PAHAL_6G227000 [Panicum hallii]